MENTLKMKFKLHELEFEIEGKEEIVKEEFKNFNENILTHLLSKLNITQANTLNQKALEGRQNVFEAVVLNSSHDNEVFDYPILKDVKLRDLPKSETEWLLIYAFYSSEFSTKEFTKENLISLYEQTDRKTINRMSNLSKNIKSLVNGLFIKSTNNTQFIILPKGKSKSIEILDGKTNYRENNKKNAKVNKVSSESDSVNTSDLKTKVKNNTSITFTDLKFRLEEMKSLQSFFNLKQPKGQNDEVAVVLNWYLENKEAKGATVEEIKYLIKIASNKVPEALSQVLINMKGPKLNLIAKDDNGKFTLTSIGVLHVDRDLPKNNK